MGNYIDKSEIDTWPSGTTDAEKDALIARIELQIEKWAETFFYEKALDFRLNGNNKNRLFIPLDADITSITNIELCGIDLPSSWIDFDESSVFLNLCTSGAYESDFAELTYRLTQYGDIGIFPRGYNNIRVQGTYGNTELLPIAKEAARILITHANEQGLANPTYPYLFKTEKIGDYSYGYGGTGYGNVYSGIREADTLIELLIRDMPTLMTP